MIEIILYLACVVIVATNLYWLNTAKKLDRELNDVTNSLQREMGISHVHFSTINELKNETVELRNTIKYGREQDKAGQLKIEEITEYYLACKNKIKELRAGIKRYEDLLDRSRT